MKNKRIISWKHLVPLEVIAGVLIVIVTFAVASNMDMKEAGDGLRATVEYMKEQCNDSEIRDMASEAKSLLRVTESVEQIRWRLNHEDKIHKKSAESKSSLEEAAKDTYLDGLFLLDKDGNIKEQYDASGLGCQNILDMTEKDALMDTLDFNEKSYTLRIALEDESHIDMAAVSLNDGKGILAGYFYTSSEYAKLVNNSVRAIMSGFRTEMSGTIVISSGNQIIISNDKTLEGTKVEDTHILKRIMESGKGNKLVHARKEVNSFGNYFGLMDKSRDYYIYAFMNEQKVFATTFVKVLYALLIYILLVFIVDMLMWNTKKIYKKKQASAQKRYTATLEEKNSQLQDALCRAEKASAAKSDFLSRMSHDIRTPLNGIIGLLKINENHFDDQQLVKENRRKMQASADQLLSLINDVLQMSKLEDGNVSLKHECINMNNLMHEIEDIIKERAINRGITWEYSFQNSDDKCPYVYGSPVHLRQIFLNIYGNCIKYNRPDGKISTFVEIIEKQEKSCVYQWKIADTGIGMSEEFLQHIFEPFSQEKNDARSVYQGTGLGMSIVKELLDTMGGFVSVTSKEGIGSDFVITIPFEIADKQADGDKELTEKVIDSNAGIQGLNLMVVEDNELNAEIVDMVLKDQGADVTVVYDGKQAVDLFANNLRGTFDAILMDIMMPVMDGLTATRTIRAMERPDAGTIPIIAMTANAFEEDVRNCLNAGMNAHLAKPIEVEKMVAVIAKFCNG